CGAGARSKGAARGPPASGAAFKARATSAAVPRASSRSPAKAVKRGSIGPAYHPGAPAVNLIRVKLAASRVLGLTLALGGGHLLELFLAHGLHHRLGGALQLGLGLVAALGGESGAGGLLLGGGLGWHGKAPRVAVRQSTNEPRTAFGLTMSGWRVGIAA